MNHRSKKERERKREGIRKSARTLSKLAHSSSIRFGIKNLLMEIASLATWAVSDLATTADLEHFFYLFEIVVFICLVSPIF